MLSWRSIWRGADVKKVRDLCRYAQDPSGLKSLSMTPLRGCISHSATIDRTVVACFIRPRLGILPDTIFRKSKRTNLLRDSSELWE